ncbi:ABC transporter permease [Arthrobacter sp. AZCC_0090]|uniref:ABC transporter permease n=1 Tax=Arthrobacter sp. AZCC_0090 TaxID=2735881 RepID=UPI00160EBA42|nr:ABC transporter permease [Arthrobacter sp. AZCC_0090]MBB6404195.1 ABC-2 type transport system permease protein [Arthrobacter sp. AZCC_0090]
MTNTGVNTARPPRGLAMSSLLRADSIVMLNSKTSLVLSALLPIVILVVTSFGKGQSRLGGSSLLVSLALTLGLLTSCLLGYTLALAHDREIGVLQRLRVTPAPNWMIITSRLVVQVATNLLASIIVVIVGAIVHGLALNVGQYLLVIAIAVIGAAMFLAIGQALVGLVQSTNAISAIGRLLMIFLLLLGLLGGSGILGDTMKTIADWSPVGALLTLFSDLLNQSAWSGQDTSSLLACVGYIVVFTSIGIRWFRWNSR